MAWINKYLSCNEVGPQEAHALGPYDSLKTHKYLVAYAKFIYGVKFEFKKKFLLS